MLKQIDSQILVSEFDELEQSRAPRSKSRYGDGGANLVGVTCDRCDKSGYVPDASVDGYYLEYGNEFEIWCDTCSRQSEHRLSILDSGHITSESDLIETTLTANCRLEVTAFAARPEWSDELTLNENVMVVDQRVFASVAELLEFMAEMRTREWRDTKRLRMSPDVEFRLLINRK